MAVKRIEKKGIYVNSKLSDWERSHILKTEEVKFSMEEKECKDVDCSNLLRIIGLVFTLLRSLRLGKKWTREILLPFPGGRLKLVCCNICLVH